MNPIKSLVAAVAVSFASFGALAQSAPDLAATPRVDQRQANQEQRIDQGVASGALTTRETHRLQKEQHLIDRAEDKAKADGKVTPHERKRLHHLQNHASRDIRRQKHDAQTRHR